ncbi:MAG: hypothetical protein KC615_21960 [Anaerolineae bacterium]|nr:hypothetical protein [Anaerolineae bacterium]MCA9895673.1 hypothetical protein [Anaerolineae bacterium]
MTHRTIMMAILCILLVTGCGTQALPHYSQSTVEAVDTDLIDYGIQVYRRNYCGSCHTLTLASTRGTFGPNHDQEGTHATGIIASDSYLGEADNASEYIRESIVQPNAFYAPGYEATNHHMPSFAHLPDADIDAIVYLLVNQK